jgi:hypothetical protein
VEAASAVHLDPATVMAVDSATGMRVTMSSREPKQEPRFPGQG